MCACGFRTSSTKPIDPSTINIAPRRLGWVIRNSSIVCYTGPIWAPGGDPTKVDPNVATFAWNANRMSDRANVPPTYGTGFALALCWLELLVCVTMMTSQRVLWPTWYKIRKQNTEYFTDTIVTMRVAEDVVDADILVNNGGTSISRGLHDAALCKCLYKFSDSFACTCECLNDFQLS